MARRMVRQGAVVPAGARQKLVRVAGLQAVTALFASAPHRVERLFYSPERRQQAGDFCAVLARVRKPFRQVGDDELARVAGTVLHGGIVALALPRAIANFDPALAVAWAREGRPLLLLDGIGNPHNLGAIARTAAFFGLPRMVLSDHPAQALPSDASYRVAEGGLEHVELYRGRPFVQAVGALRRSHLVVGAAAEGGEPLTALTPSERPFALILGNEEEGLPAATTAACERLVTIPGSGSVQSLNVSASAAILMYALSAHRGLEARQRSAAE